MENERGEFMINNEDFSKVVRQKCDYYIPKFEGIIENKDIESSRWCEYSRIDSSFCNSIYLY